MEFGRPNPWDVEKDFQQPMQKLLQESSGSHGSTSINGRDLRRTILEKMTRAAVSAGNTVKAIIQKTQEDEEETKYLEGNPITVSVDEEDLQKNIWKNIRNRIREKYLNVRNMPAEK
jgi:hypothetical protein